jgi:hypothetical protein
MLSKIFDEYPYKSTDTEKSTDAGDICWHWPIHNFLHLGFMGDTAFIITPLTQNSDGGNAELEFLARECAADVFEPLQDVVDIDKVLPDKAADTRILGNSVVGARILIGVTRHLQLHCQ